MDIKQLETFCKAAETGSFSKAGEAVYLTQPTVSGHIASLEKQVGLKLFDRLGRRVALTQGGKVLYRYAKEILRLRDEAINAISEFSNLVKGKIAIGGSTIPGEYFLPAVMSRFHKEFPGITINLLIADSQQIIDRLRAGDIEIGVVGMEFEEEGMTIHPLFQDRVIVISPPNHPLAEKDGVSWNEVRAAPILLREKGSGTRRAFEHQLAAAGLRLHDLIIVGEVGSSTAVKEGVKRGIGLGVISDLAVREEINRGELREVIIKGATVSTNRTFYACAPRNRDISPPARRFLEFLKTQSAEP